MNLPNNSKVNRFLPKNKFYEKANITESLKKEFIDKIKRITWKYNLSKKSIGIVGTNNAKEIQVFEIELKCMKIPKKALQIIDKSIPYAILYKFTYKDNFAYGIALKKGKDIKKYFFSEWNKEIDFEFYGKDLESVYQNIIKKLIPRNIDPSLSFEKIIEIDNEMEKLEKNISTLKRKLSKEKQFKKQFEFYREMKIMEKKLLEIKSKYCI